MLSQPGVMAALPADGGCEPTWLPDPDLSGSLTAPQPTTTPSLTLSRYVSSRAHYIVVVALLLLNLLVPLPSRSPTSCDDVHAGTPLSFIHSTTTSSSFFFTSDVLFSTSPGYPFTSFSITSHLVDLDFFSSRSLFQLNTFLSFLSPTPSLGRHLSSLRDTQCHGKPPAHVNLCHLWL